MMVAMYCVRLFAVWLLLAAPLVGLGQDYLAQAKNLRDPLQRLEVLYKALEQAQTTDVYWALGWAHIELGQYPNAVADFEAGLAAKQGTVNEASFRAALGYVFYLQDLHTKAIAALDQALALSPTYTFAMRYRAYALLALGRFAEAEAQLTTHIETAPDDPQGLYLRAGARLSQKKLEQALSDINAALLAKPSEPTYLQRKILILIDLRREAEVTEIAAQLTEFTSSSGPAYYNLALVFQKSGDYASCIRFLDVALQKHQAQVSVDATYRAQRAEFVYDILLAKGYTYYQMRNYTAALGEYSRAANSYPNRWEAYQQLGYLRMTQEAYLEATQAWEQLFRLRPTHPEGWVNLGFAYSELDMPDAALRTYTRALQLDSVESKALLYNNRGFLYLEHKKDYTSAKADFEASLRLDPQQAMTYVSMGELYLFQQQYAAALPWFDRALAIERRTVRESFAAYYRKGQALLAAADHPGAIENLLRAQRMNNTYADPNYLLGQAYTAQGDHCAALNALRAALNTPLWFDTAQVKEVALLHRNIELNHKPVCN